MAQSSFDVECDRLSHVVDEAQFERLRWARVEGPVLTKLVDLANGAIEHRSEFELAEEGSTFAVKSFILKIHGFRVVGISLFLEDGLAKMTVETTARSNFTALAGEPICVAWDGLDEAWMTAAMQEAFGRVR